MSSESEMPAQHFSVLTASSISLHSQVADLVARQHITDRLLAQNTLELHALRTSIKQNSEVMTEVQQLFETLKGGFKVIGWFGNGVKWVAMAAAAFATLWYAVTHGGSFPPKI